MTEVQDMEKKKQLDRASCHSGKANKQGVAYNPNHNTMEQARAKQPHIDQERMGLNSYLQYMADGQAIKHKGGQGGYDSRQHEMQRYKELYGKGLEARNERYKASGHKDRCKTLSKVYRDPKTCPTEIIFQLGNSESETDKEKRTAVMVGAWAATMKIFVEKYGENFIPLDSALHRDETEDHIHFRYTLGARDKFGNFVPNQSGALEAMGFKPDPSQARGRYNNPLIAFTDELRETYYRECERRGITINREVISESRRQRDLLAIKCDGFRKELEQLEAARQAALTDTKQAQEAQTQAEADKKAAEDRSKELEAENEKLKAENNQLRAANKSLNGSIAERNAKITELNNKAAQLNLQIEANQRSLDAAKKGLEQAKADRAAAVEAAKLIEQHQKDIYKKYAKDFSPKVYETLPAQKQKRSISGKVTQEERPECVVVDKKDFERTKEFAKYHVEVNYNKATIEELDKRISENDIVQQQQAQLNDQQTEINRLQQQIKEKDLKIAQQGNTIFYQQQVLQQNGLDWIVQQMQPQELEMQDLEMQPLDEEIKPDYE